MRRSRYLKTLGLIGAAIGLAGAAMAGTRTYVALAGRNDAIPKLGRPGIAVRVGASTETDAAVLTSELARELAQQVHTRRLASDEAGDYDLEVTLDAPRIDGRATTIPFEAVLQSAQGERLWRIEGRADVEGDPLDASVFAGIGRNVVSALIHDGWVLPRYDPDDPPPQPPTVRKEPN
jgi:hypothetical protein